MIADLKPYAEYKESGLPWLGELPGHWNRSRVKNLARPGYGTFIDGDWIESPFIRERGIRLIQTGNIGVGLYREKGYRYIDEETFQAFGCTEFQPGDVLICRLGDPVGRACLAPNLGVRMITSVDVCILKARQDILPALVVYMMSVPQYLHWVGSLVRGSTRDRVSRSMLGSFIVPLPPSDEQAAIVRFLDWANGRLERAIRAKRKVIALLNEQKQAIIHRAVTRGLDPAVRLKPSGIPWLGDIPQHWEVWRIKYLLREVDKRSSTGSEPLLSMRMHHGLVLFADHFTRPPQAATLVGFKLVRPGQFVVNRMQAGNGVIFASTLTGLVSPDYAVFDPIGDANVDFLGELFRSRKVRAKFRAESKGLGTGTSGFLRLYNDRLGAIHVALPPRDEQGAILSGLARELSGAITAISHLEREIELLREYRTRLVADVVTGKLDVRDAAARLPDEATPGTVEDDADLGDETEAADEEAAA